MINAGRSVFVAVSGQPRQRLENMGNRAIAEAERGRRPVGPRLEHSVHGERPPVPAAAMPKTDDIFGRDIFSC